MIAMARSIGHGGKYMDYMDGESKNKKHPEKIYFLQSHFLQPQLDGTALENAFKNRCRGHPGMKKYAIEIVFSPPPEYTKDFSLQDWARLEDDFTTEFDDIELRCPKTGKLWSEKTNISGSKRVSFLHKESKSGVHHLHMGVCRVDENDNTNNDHMIHERAQWAAERVAIKRGWKTAAQVHKENVAEVSKMCRQILLKMDLYSFEKYVAEIEKRGYSVSVKEGNTGYAIMNGHAKYKGSELDGRHYTIPNLLSTWKKLHAEEDEKRREKEASTINSDFSSKITQLKQANQVNITQEAKAYIEEQSTAISKRVCNDLEAKSRKIVARMTYQTDRVQIPTSACYVLCLSLIILVVGFALLIMLNLYRIRNEMLTQFIWIVCGAFVCFNLITIITFAWVRNRD